MSEIIHSAVEHLFVEQGRRGCGPGCLLVTQECKCGLARRLRVLEGVVRAVEVKLPRGHWVDLITYLRVQVPYMLCPRCNGEGCETCKRLGVLERIPPHAGVPPVGVAP